MQLLAAGVIGGLVGGTVVGVLGAVTGDHDHQHGRYAEYGRHGGPFMRGDGPYWRYRGQDGGTLPGPGWYSPRSGKVPGQDGQPAYPVPVRPAPPVPPPSPVSPSPSATTT